MSTAVTTPRVVTTWSSSGEMWPLPWIEEMRVTSSLRIVPVPEPSAICAVPEPLTRLPRFTPKVSFASSVVSPLITIDTCCDSAPPAVNASVLGAPVTPTKSLPATAVPFAVV